MDKDNIQNLINERISQLPEIVKKEVLNGDWLETIRKIVKDNDLLIDQGLVIERETLLMILGIESPKNYTKNIKKEANLSNEEAVSIAFEVDEKILKEIKRKLIQKGEEEAGLEENPLKDIIGPKNRIDEILPDVDINLSDENEANKEPEPNQADEEERQKLINELQQDIEIDDEEEKDPVETPQKQEVPENLPQEPVKENQIPFKESGEKNPRIIDGDFSDKHDNLPGLEPLRTLESDSKNKDDIVSSKLGGSSVNKPQDKNISDTENNDGNIPKKDGPDPYREPIE